jgi:GMP synthase (glutamine-hydrolysing)
MPWEGPGLIEEELAAAGIGVQVRSITRQARLGVPLPDLSEVSAVVIMGGPQSADAVDRHPGLAWERAYAAAAVNASVPVLGVCLGHQILSLALGGGVRRAERAEFGFAPVDLTDDGARSPLAAIRGLPVLQWHEDVADLPDGARLLASTPDCPNQAFAVGSALGLQFHLEVGAALFARWMAQAPMREDLRGHGVVGLAERAAEVYPVAEEAYREVLRGWARRLPDAR